MEARRKVDFLLLFKKKMDYARYAYTKSVPQVCTISQVELKIIDAAYFPTLF